MKHFNFIRQLLKNQQFIFWVTIIVLIVPNLFLFFTEPLSFSTRVAYLTIPGGFYLIWTILAPKPGWMIWLSLPFFTLGAFQLVLLYLFGNSIIAVDMFTNVVTTNAGEASELLESIWPAILGVCVLYIPLLGIGIYSVRNTKKLTAKFRINAIKTGAILLVTGGLASVYSSVSNPLYEFKHVIFPLNVMYNINYAIERWHLSNNYPESSAQFRFNAQRKKVSDKKEVYILIIGETSRAENWELNGYPRQTNPLLSRRDDVIFFHDAITQSNTTHKSVPLILAPVNAQNYDDIYHSKSIITAFKECGFRTLFISNQVPNRSLIDYFAAEADKRINLSPINNDLYKENLPDGKALKIIEQAINESNQDLFIVFHSYGSHFNYQHRYPKEMAYFKPDNSSTVSYHNKQNLFNAYDNSVRYTDFLLDSTISLLNKPEICSGLFYLSDHGEDLMDDDRRKFLHASPIPTYHQLHIPMIMWLSDNYTSIYPHKKEAVILNRQKPASTASTFNTVTDMADIHTVLGDASYSLLDSTFAVRNRYYVNDHNDACYFFNMGLDQIDLENIDINHLYYDHSLYKKPIY
ncbi:MAG: sulfatase-like hydrolase/transferase [Bacteroidales bacterium]